MADEESIKKLREFEEGAAGNSAVDKIGSSIDVKTTTTNGVLANYAQNKIYKVDSLAGIENWKGQVLRVEEIPKPQDGGDGGFLGRIFDDKIYKCRVRIPGLHSHLPIPVTFDENPKDKNIINQYPSMIYDPFFPFFETMAVGDIVQIEFGNLSNFTNGRILCKVGAKSKPLGFGSVGAVIDAAAQGLAAVGAAISDAFSDKPTNSPTPASQTMNEAPNNGGYTGPITIAGVSGPTDKTQAFFTYSNSLQKAPLVLLFGGIRKFPSGSLATWAHGLGIEKKVPVQIKNKTFIYYLEYDNNTDIDTLIQQGKNICKKYGKEPTDIKILGFSGGGKNAHTYFFQSPQKFSFLGLLDPSINRYNNAAYDPIAIKYKDKIKMTYNTRNWNALGTTFQVPLRHLGGLTNNAESATGHEQQPDEFFRKFADYIVRQG